MIIEHACLFYVMSILLCISRANNDNLKADKVQKFALELHEVLQWLKLS
jgi:hypothetical protein